MKIHEYQAKAILAQYNVPVPRGQVAYTVEEAEAAAKTLGGSVVVKAQIHAGGRGKGGGVKVAKDAAEAAKIADKILGMTLITHQTGPEGRVVHRVVWPLDGRLCDPNGRAAPWRGYLLIVAAVTPAFAPDLGMSTASLSESRGRTALITGALFLGSTGAFLLLVSVLSIMTVASVLLRLLLMFELGIQVGTARIPQSETP
jgi:hypothetical protein